MPATARQGILGRLDIDSWRSSSKIEALVEELSNLRNQDATTKSIVFSQFVNFLDLIAFRLQRAGFSVTRFRHWSGHRLMAALRFAGSKVQ
jgi:DNA repair protein RAD16